MDCHESEREGQVIASHFSEPSERNFEYITARILFCYRLRLSSLASLKEFLLVILAAVGAAMILFLLISITLLIVHKRMARRLESEPATPTYDDDPLESYIDSTRL